MFIEYIRRNVLVGTFFVLFACFFQLNSQSTDVVQARYQHALEVFQIMHDQKKLKDYNSMVQLFSLLEKQSALLIKQIRQDMQSVKKVLKKCFCKELQSMHDELKNLSSFVKKNKINYDAIIFHNNITSLYQQLFDMVDNNEDVVLFIAKNKELFDLKSDDNRFLHTFIKGLVQARHKVSQYEDYLHSDDIDLKLQNYVFKIELVKLRNAIIFDKRYKFQK